MQPRSHALPPLQLSGRRRRRSVVMPGAFVGLVPPPSPATSSPSSDDSSIAEHCSSGSGSSSDTERGDPLNAAAKPTRARRAALQSARLAGLHAPLVPADARSSCNARTPSAPSASNEPASALSQAAHSLEQGRYRGLQSVNGSLALRSMPSTPSTAQQPAARARRAGLGHYRGPSLASMACICEPHMQLAPAVGHGNGPQSSSSSDDEVYG